MNHKVGNIVDRLEALLATRSAADETMVLVKEALREIANALPDDQTQGFAHR